MGTEAENEAAEESMRKTRLGKKYLEVKDTVKDTVKDMLGKKDTGEKTKPIDDKYKKGGPVSKAVMQKAGFYDKNKTEKERQNIVKKVTNKPQRVAIVEKAFLTKKMSEGGKVAGKLATRGYGIAKNGKLK